MKDYNWIHLPEDKKKRLVECYRQGNTIASTAYKLNMSFQEIESYYCLLSLQNINEMFHLFQNRN